PTPRQAKSVKRTTVEVKEVERRFTKPEAPPPAAKQLGPCFALEEFRGTRGKIIGEITDRLLVKMRSLIAATPEDDPQKPDFYFRAGELHLEKQRFFSNRVRGLDQKIFELPPERRGPSLAEQQSWERKAEASLLEAV